MPANGRWDLIQRLKVNILITTYIQYRLENDFFSAGTHACNFYCLCFNGCWIVVIWSKCDVHNCETLFLMKFFILNLWFLSSVEV